MAFSFHVTVNDSSTRARRGVLRTLHGEVETPIFMPVGTHGAVRSLSPDELVSTGSRLILGNTYHLYLRPGHETIRDLGGLHRFMAWPGPILTDSGGYQVFSLSDLRTVDDDGVAFRSHLDGSSHLLTPEKAIEIQTALGSDIAMVLDECPSSAASREDLVAAMRRTTDWASRCKDAFEGQRGSDRGALFGIVQGGVLADLRREHARAITGIGFDGYAVGGVSVGESSREIHEVGVMMGEILPEDAPRYMMGLGTPEDLIRLIGNGFDMFDCVVPTRHARNGTLFTSTGSINIKNEAHTADPRPLDEDCPCLACTRFSRAYLRHLFMSREILGHRLNSIHNVTHYQRLMNEARAAISLHQYGEWSAARLSSITRRDGDEP